MRRLAPAHDHTAAAPPRLAPLFAVFALLVLAAAFAAYFAVARSAATHHASGDARPTKVANLDRSGTPWLLPEPAVATVAHATDKPAKTQAAAPEPDWSAFSLGVSSAEAAIVPHAIDDASPADLKVAMSKDERSRLMAAARDAEDGVTPAGYRPMIGMLYPEGSGGGTCK